MADIPCPHCGQLNEKERDVCWACCKPLKSDAALPPPQQSTLGPFKVTTTTSTKITINGEQYDRLADVPEQFRSLIKDAIAHAGEGKKSRAGIARGPIRARPRLTIGPISFFLAFSPNNQPLDHDPSVPVPPPDGFRIESNGPQRLISWRWLSRFSIGGILFAFALGMPFWFVLYICLHSPADAPWPLLWGLGIIPGGIAYAWIGYLVNRTTVRIDPARVLVEHGPLPWLGGKNVLKADIDRVVSERYRTSSDTSDGTMFEPEETYQVKLVLKSGKTRMLASGLLEPGQALFLEQEVRRPL
jgi:hypothetical protein